MVKVTGGRRWRSGRARDVNFQVTRAGDRSDVYVCAMWRASGRCGPKGYQGKRTDSFLSFFSLFHRTTDATASLVVEVPAGISVDAKTTVGAVRVEGVHAGVTARSVNGSIAALNVGGALNLTTTNGNIDLSVDSLAGTDTIKATTINGVVRAQLPANIEAEFDVSTVNGGVRTDFPLSTSQARRHGAIAGRLGTAPRYVKLHSVNGSVAVMKSASSDSGTPTIPAVTLPTPSRTP